MNLIKSEYSNTRLHENSNELSVSLKIRKKSTSVG
jgi:hypothetical protein